MDYNCVFIGVLVNNFKLQDCFLIIQDKETEIKKISPKSKCFEKFPGVVSSIRIVIRTITNLVNLPFNMNYIHSFVY